MMDPDSYTLTRSELESKRHQLSQAGVHLSGDSGTLTAQGCTIRYTYREPYLIVQVMDKPFFVPESVVTSKIRSWFQS
jgi:hypothetical protein